LLDGERGGGDPGRRGRNSQDHVRSSAVAVPGGLRRVGSWAAAGGPGIDAPARRGARDCLDVQGRGSRGPARRQSLAGLVASPMLLARTERTSRGELTNCAFLRFTATANCTPACSRLTEWPSWLPATSMLC